MEWKKMFVFELICLQTDDLDSSWVQSVYIPPEFAH